MIFLVTIQEPVITNVGCIYMNIYRPGELVQVHTNFQCVSTGLDLKSKAVWTGWIMPKSIDLQKFEGDVMFGVYDKNIPTIFKIKDGEFNFLHGGPADIERIEAVKLADGFNFKDSPVSITH